MAPVSIPSIAPAEPFSRTSGNVGPGAVWTVFNVNDEGSSVDSVDWGLWKDKALKWLSGAWTFAGEHGMFFIVLCGLYDFDIDRPSLRWFT